MRILHDFGEGVDGTIPYAGVIFDGAGNLYGTEQQNECPEQCSINWT
jgi:hypothetical protein